MAKAMQILSAVFAILGAIFVVVYLNFGYAFSLAITFCTITYHLLMRLLVGYAINGIFHNRMDHTNLWFKQRKFEKKLYRALKVRKWKGFMPTYAPDSFSAEKHTLPEIVGAMCQAEIVHEVIIPLSFLPIFFVPLFGSFWAFFITSVLSALFDSSFAIMQRFNRPRVIALMERKA